LSPIATSLSLQCIIYFTSLTQPILLSVISFFSYNTTATSHISTLSLHDALPIWAPPSGTRPAYSYRSATLQLCRYCRRSFTGLSDRKSTRLNSSHVSISYAVFCLKKKKNYVNIYYEKIVNLNVYSNIL